MLLIVVLEQGSRKLFRTVNKAQQNLLEYLLNFFFDIESQNNFF